MLPAQEVIQIIDATYETDGSDCREEVDEHELLAGGQVAWRNRVRQACTVVRLLQVCDIQACELRLSQVVLVNIWTILSVCPIVITAGTRPALHVPHVPEFC